MNVVDIILSVYCAILTIVVLVYVVSKDKDSEQKINDFGRNKIPVIYGYKLYYIFSDSTPFEITKIIGDPNSVNIDPHGNGTIEYVHSTSSVNIIKVSRIEFKFSKFNLVEIK